MTAIYHNLASDITFIPSNLFDNMEYFKSIADTGWVPIPGTPVRIDNNRFYIIGDQTGINSIGDYIRITQTVNRYFALFNISYNSVTNKTTYTIIGDPSYPLVDAPIINPCFSKSPNPTGYPHVFDYVPTLTGWGSAPTDSIYRWSLKGNICKVFIRQVAGGVSDSTSTKISAPYQAKNILNMAWGGKPTIAQDNGVWTDTSSGSISANSSDIVFSIGVFSTGWTASGAKRIPVFQIEYEIGVV